MYLSKNHAATCKEGIMLSLKEHEHNAGHEILKLPHNNRDSKLIPLEIHDTKDLFSLAIVYDTNAAIGQVCCLRRSSVFETNVEKAPRPSTYPDPTYL
jgi:hypothetical protein